MPQSQKHRESLDAELPSYAEALGAQTSSSSGSTRPQWASLSLHDEDLVRLLAFPAEMQTVVRSVLQTNWREGIQREQNYGPSYEFKLRGMPWRCAGSDGVTSRRLVLRLLSALYNAGWVLETAGNVSKAETDLGAMFFRHQVSAPPVVCEWMCISFSKEDQIRFIDCPAGDAEVVQTFIRTIGSVLQRVEKPWVPGCQELKLKGTPWSCVSGRNTMMGRCVVIILLRTLEQFGWSVYASVDQKRGTAQQKKDTWHCHKRVNWVSGTPVYPIV